MLHEIAHCWFGDLVTMKWWDDLWLNESFADYMGFYALEKILPKITSYKYQTAMISFFWRKLWGYEEDASKHFTHPVRGLVANTDLVLILFDGITYAKGASIIKMLIYLIGE
jgi:aminopeptidase N